jgi:subtilase family serine protease
VSSEPATTTPGGSIKLWARVTNTGVAALPADATVWFYVDGPSWTGSHWIGSVPAGGLASGAERWYDLNWGVPADRSPGNYRVSAQVWAPGLGAVSPWSPAHDFAVSVPLPPRARVLSVYPVPEREPGQVAVFWALVRNDGNVRFPAGSAVWFYVAGPGVTNNWAASKDVSGLEPGQTRWYDVEWVPQNSGQFTYWAQVWRSGAGAISPWSAGQRFNACFVCVF